MAERSTCREILVAHVAAGALGGGIGAAVLREGMQTERPALIAIGAVTGLASVAMSGIGIIRRPCPDVIAPPVVPDLTPNLVPNSTDL